MRKSISVTFFSMVATLLVLGTAVLGCSEWLLFSRYFAQERYDTLDSVADVTQRAADYIVQQAALPKGAELDALNTKLEIIGESAEAYLFFTDEEGRVLIASNPEMVGADVVGPELMKKVAGDQPYHTLSTLDGVLTEKSYVSVRHMQDAQGNNSGYLFLCSSGASAALPQHRRTLRPQSDHVDHAGDQRRTYPADRQQYGRLHLHGFIERHDRSATGLRRPETGLFPPDRRNAAA